MYDCMMYDVRESGEEVQSRERSTSDGSVTTFDFRSIRLSFRLSHVSAILI